MGDMINRLYKSFQGTRKKTTCAGWGESVSGLVEAEAVAWLIGESIVNVLKLWLGYLSKPKSIQYDNNSHFTARVV